MRTHEDSSGEEDSSGDKELYFGPAEADFWVKDNLGHILSKITQDHMILSIYIGAGYSLQRRWNE